MHRLFVSVCIACITMMLQAKAVYDICVNAGSYSNRCQTNRISSGYEANAASENIENYLFCITCSYLSLNHN